jgi:hypothetical protein
MRRVLVAGALAVIALAGVFLIWGRASFRGSRAANTSRAEDGAAAVPEAALAAGTRGAAIRIRGTVKDEDGYDLSERDGTVRFTVDATGTVEADVHDGTWEASAPVGSVLAFESVRFDDRRAVAVPPTIEVPGNGHLEMHWRWAVPTLLRAVGPDGAEFESVEYYDDRYGSRDEVKRSSSPIELATAEGSHTYAVRAAGHVWSRITVHVGLGGERTVRLARAGALDVRLDPYDPEAGISIQVVGADGEWWAEPDASGRALVESLPPGETRVAARVAFAWGEDHVLAEAEVKIRTGATTALSLAPREPPPPPDLVPLEGTVRADPAWPEEPDDIVGFCVVSHQAPLTVLAATLDWWSPDAEIDPDEGTWSAGLVLPGRYFLLFRDWSYAAAIDVGPQGTTDASIVVPPPCDVEVHLVDAESGAPVPDGHDLWWCVRAADVGSEVGLPWRCERDVPSASPGVYRFRAPQGTLVLDFYSDLRSSEETEVALKPGANRIELRVAPNLRIDFELRDGTIPVPADAAFSDRIKVAALTGDGELSCCGEGDPCVVWFTKPGRYRVTFPEIEGYEPIAPVEVEVAAGSIARVEIALRRKAR